MISVLKCIYWFCSTPLHLAVKSDNRILIKVLLDDARTDCERQDKLGFVPLWYALNKSDVSISSFIAFIARFKPIYLFHTVSGRLCGLVTHSEMCCLCQCCFLAQWRASASLCCCC